jgi:hypothetical protein
MYSVDMRTYTAAREGRGVFVGAGDVFSIRMPTNFLRNRKSNMLLGTSRDSI